MAYYSISKRQRKNTTVYLAKVRVKESGVEVFSKSKTFHTKSAANKWAKALINKVENNINNTYFDLIDCTFGELIDTYVSKKKNSDRPIGRTATFALRQIREYAIANILVTRLSSSDIVEFCQQRKNSATQPSPQTISIDVSCIRKVLKVAKSMFNVNVDERPVIDAYPALHDLRLITRSHKRERRLEKNEFEQLMVELKKKESHHSCIIPYADIFQISLVTCCLIGEVCNMRWQDVDYKARTIIIRDRKNPNGSLGNNSILPLLGSALNIIERQPRVDDRIFPYNSRSITSGFRRSLKKLGVTDLRYHDLRREGASKLIERGLSIEEAARITGHKDLNILWQVYVVMNPVHFEKFKDINVLNRTD